MYNRSIVDATFTAAGVSVQPAIKVNSIFTIALRVMAGSLCSVLPDALAGTGRGYCELKNATHGPRGAYPHWLHVACDGPTFAHARDRIVAGTAMASGMRHAAAQSGLLVV